uniref:Uncharacterized protein n=1 Tax=Panagrellus redivivus TaxID=6233 RepID=A0A7E4W6D9_PANRE
MDALWCTSHNMASKCNQQNRFFVLLFSGEGIALHVLAMSSKLNGTCSFDFISNERTVAITSIAHKKYG